MYDQQFNPYGGNLAIVKNYFKSGKVLALGIFCLISVVLTFIMTSTVSFTTIIYRVLDYLTSRGIDLPYQYREAVAASSASSAIFSAIISSIFPVLTAIAFIFIFVKSRNASETSSPITGVSILYVLSVISLVFTIIGVVLFALVYIGIFIIGVSAGNRINSDYSAVVIVGMVFLGIFLIVYAVVAIFYAVSRKNFYRSIKRSITTPELESKGAVPFGVFNIIMAVFSVFSIGSGFMVLPDLGGILLVSTIISMLVNIFFAIIALGYNKYITGIKQGINTVPYGAAPYQAAPGAPYNMPNYTAPQPQNPPYADPAAPTNEQPPYAEQPQPQAMYCPNCGARTEPGAPFCSNCGTKL